jgi:tRNA modification GTPase
VGKSSLFNRLVEHERAIVTATPGTTRDLVTETVSIGGIPVRLVDTAGIRDSLDEAESIGVRKSLEALADADIVLVVLDASHPASDDAARRRDTGLISLVTRRLAIVVQNKIDAVATAPLMPDGGLTVVMTSAKTGQGIEQLRAKILRLAGGDGGSQPETGFLTNVRHQRLVQDSIAALDKAAAAVPLKTPHEMLLLDLYSALRPLDEITGATTADDILNLIFSSFCIGK